MELTRINSFANLEALKTEQAEFEKIIQGIIDKIQSVGKIESALGSAGSSKDTLKGIDQLTQQTKELTTATGDYKKKLDDTVAAQKENAGANTDDAKGKSDNTKATKELTIEEAKRSEAIKANNKNIRDQAREALGLIDAYKQLSSQYEVAARAAQNLIVTKGKDDEETKAAIANAQKLAQQLKEADALVGKFGRNVGDYANSLAAGFQKVTDELTRLKEKQSQLQDFSQRNPVGFKQGPIGNSGLSSVAGSTLTGQAELEQTTVAIQQLEKIQQLGTTSNLTYADSLKVLDTGFKQLETSGVQSETFLNGLKASVDRAKIAALEAEGPYGQLVIRFKAAALEAQNLAAQYGIESKQAKEAAKTALDLGNQIREIDKSVGKSSESIGLMGKTVESTKESLKRFALEALSLVGIFSVASFLKDSIDAFLELDKTTRLLQNTLRNVGAQDYFGRIEKSTKDLSSSFKFLREEDIQSTFNKLIVYGKLTENQINSLLPVIVDFATATGRTMPEATAILIKSLEGNNRGLREFGINIKDAKSPAEAFSLVMKELAPRVEGVAQAFGESQAGKIAATNEEFRKLKETVGQELVPVLSSLLSGLDKIFTGLGYLAKRVAEVTEDFLTLGASASARAADKQHEINKKVAEKQLEEFKDLSKEELSEVRNGLQLFIEQYQKEFDTLQTKTDSASIKRKTALAQTLEIERALVAGIFKLQDRDPNKVIGIGDPDKPFKTGKEHDADADFFKNEEAKRKAAFDAQKAIIEANIAAADAIASNDKKSFAERLKAAQDFYDQSLLLIAKTKEFELTDVDAKANEDKRKATKEIADKTERAKVLKSIDEKAGAERLKIEADFDKSIGALTNTDEKKRADIIKKNLDDVEAHRKSVHEEELTDITAGYDEALADLDQQYATQIIRDKNNKKALLKDEKEYNEEKLRLQTQQQIELLKADIRFAQETLQIQEAIAEQSGKQEDIDKVTAARQKIHDLDIKLTTLAANFKIQSNKNIQKSDEEVFAEKMAQLQKIADYSSQVYGVIGDFIGANAEKEKQAAQDQIDALEAKRQKDIDVATQTITNAADQANAIVQINLQADAQKAQLVEKQKKADEQKARFDKAANIASIIEETALAVIRALGDKTIPLPARIAEAVAIGAIGAAKLAVAAATPIPHYKIGLAEAKESHVGVVGDGGKHEFVRYADGSGWVTPNKPTLTYIPKGAEIFADIETMKPAASATIPAKKSKFFSWSKSNVTAGDEIDNSRAMEVTASNAAFNHKQILNELNVKEQNILYQQLEGGLQTIALPVNHDNSDLIRAIQNDGKKTRETIENKQENYFNIMDGQIDARSKKGTREIIYLNKNLQF